MLKQRIFDINMGDKWRLHVPELVTVLHGGHACTDLHQVVVGPVEVFVQLDHQALKERRELLFLLPWL